MSEGKPYRGVIVYDIELEGGIDEAYLFKKALKEFSKQFEDYLADTHPEVAEKVTITLDQADMPMQERRGATGDLNQIVFRGTRGSYATSTKFMMFQVRGYDEKEVWLECLEEKEAAKFTTMPINRLPKVLQNQFVRDLERDKGGMLIEIKLREETWRQNSTQSTANWGGKHPA